MQNFLKKTDAIISIIIGLCIGIFFFIILKTIGLEIPYRWLLIVLFPPAALVGMVLVSWLGRRFLFILQAGRFVLVGALNTFVDLGVLNLLIFFSGISYGILYTVFKSIAFLMATVNSYYWNKYWTFGKKRKGFVPGEFSKFLVTVAIGFGLNVGIASLVVNILGPQFGISAEAWASVGALTASLFAWIWNFIGSKFFVFKA
ncbi:hypothetical protein AMJ48_02740 [Parcubacteria bacterium DG_74_1]|nr:MAG: hypothetical protein AMJ48_02740 [Parcubacteria bacterium DG_74_1]